MSNFAHTLQKALHRAGLSHIDTSKKIREFSGGQKTRIALAALFAAMYDVILLDEPTNNLDLAGTLLLEEFVKHSKAAFVIVSHDRKFLRNTTTSIVELLGERGMMHYGLGYDEYMTARHVQHEAIAKRHEHYEREKKHIQKSIKEANRRANSAASRSAKADNDKLTHNFRTEKASTNLAGAAKGVESRLAQLEEPERPIEDISLEVMLQSPSRKRHLLLAAHELTATYDKNERIFGPLSLSIYAGETILLSGENGTGKTTLMKALAGALPVHSGERRLGGETELLYIDQQQSLPLPRKNAIDNLRALAPHLSQHDAMHILLRFHLNKEVMQTTRGEQLSGGERAKVLLAAAAANHVNLLLLDEPTNNLDIPTIEGLEHALRQYRGGIILVSHDREFIEGVGVDREIGL